MTKREFLDIVFALAPTEANAIMDAFDEYVESNEPHWIPVEQALPEEPFGCHCPQFIKENDMSKVRDLTGMRYCRIKGKFCIYATEHGYCSFTACREVTE